VHAVPPTDTAARIVLRPNCSLSRTHVRRFLVALALADLALAVFSAARGAWPVVPYLLFQFALLGGVLWVLRRRAAADCEIVTLDDTRLCIERRTGSHREEFAFPRYWARVALDPPRGGQHSRLRVRSHGREVEIGATLLEEQRRQLAQRLGQAVGPEYRAAGTPALAVDAFDISRFNPSPGDLHGSG